MVMIVFMVAGSFFTAVCAGLGYLMFSEVNMILRNTVVLVTSVAGSYGIAFIVIEDILRIRG